MPLLVAAAPFWIHPVRWHCGGPTHRTPRLTTNTRQTRPQSPSILPVLAVKLEIFNQHMLWTI